MGIASLTLVVISTISLVPLALGNDFDPYPDADLELLTPSGVILLGSNSQPIQELTQWEAVTIGTNITNNDSRRDWDIVAIFEVRDANGITQSISWQSGTVSAGGQTHVRVPWIPQIAGFHDIRILVISDSSNPRLLFWFSESQVSVAKQNELEGLRIAMERGPCSGPCPAYTVELFGNGTVVYHGSKNVVAEGEHRSKVSVDDIRTLLYEFERTKFLALGDEYGFNCIGCPTTIVSITNVTGETKTVKHVSGGDVPVELVEIEQKIDYILGTSGWVR